LESLEFREMLSATPLSFRVVDDASLNKTFAYTASGTAQGSTTLATANSAPRGVTSTIGIDKTWVVDANRNVYVYNSTGSLLGSWSAGSMANNATPEGIATDGKDVWIVDSRNHMAYRYADAAGRLSGNQTAASSFFLGSGANQTDIVTDGNFLFVLEDGKKTDWVHRWTMTGGDWGYWQIDTANKTPTGIALDPANIGDIWISDSGTDRVYRYAAAAGFSGGSLSATSSFALASGDANAQGIAVAGRAWAETPYQVEWIKQFGTAADDWGRGVTADTAGHIYISGVVNGTLSPTVGTPYLAQFDSAGNQIWFQGEIAQNNHEAVRLAADTLGNVFQIINNPGGDATPASLSGFDTSGNLRWTSYLSAMESTFSVAVDDLGYAYVSSYEGNNVHVRKFDGVTGSVVWETVLDTGGACNSSGISADHLGNIYVAAYTYGTSLGPNVGAADALIAKLTDTGQLLWARQFGTSVADYAFMVSTDSFGNAYISGQTAGSLGGPNAGNQDNFLAKYDSTGSQLWVRQFGTTANESSSSSWIDPVGNIYRAMTTTGALAGPHYGESDIAVVKYDPAGNILWATQLGTSVADSTAGGIWGDAQGNLYIAGKTSGSLGGPNAGAGDAFLIKLSAFGASAVNSSQTTTSLVRSASSTSTNSSSRPTTPTSDPTNVRSSTDAGQILSLLQAIHKSDASKPTGSQFSASCQEVDAAFTKGFVKKWSHVLDEVLASIT
jgi:hypothetical protein